MFYINNDKLKRVNLNKDNFFVMMDFDQTITTDNSDDSWTVLQNPNIVNPEFNEKALFLYEKYGPIEKSYSIDFNTKSAHMDKWYFEVMDLMYDYGLTYPKLLDCVKCGNMVLRDGFSDFLYALYKNNIPVVILSAGIGNVIYEFFKLHNLLYNNVHIISNFIKFEHNAMLPFNDTMIHSCNKDIAFYKSDFSNIYQEKDFILLFGNVIEDIHMVNLEDLARTVSFGFLDRNINENFELYKKNFDVVLTNNSSFLEVRNILK